MKTLSRIRIPNSRPHTFSSFCRYPASNFLLDSLIFFFRQLITFLSVFWILKHNEGIVQSSSEYNSCDYFPEKITEGPFQTCHDDVKQKTEGWIEQKSKVDCNGSADKLKLGF